VIALVAIGSILLCLIGGVAHVWLAHRAQALGTVFEGEIRIPWFTYKTHSRPSEGETQAEPETK
jgi:hypothetical protein